MPSGIPIGTITSFAGDTSNAAVAKIINDEGWLVCQGVAYNKNDFADLFAVIGTSHGGQGDMFNVPDLQSRFIRGTNYNAGSGTPVDPDVNARTSAAPGGATGNKVGSLEASATALPKTSWTLSTDGDHHHQLYHLNNDMHEAWSGSWITFARWNQTQTVSEAGTHSHTISGGDVATVPINVALSFIIKAKSV